MAIALDLVAPSAAIADYVGLIYHLETEQLHYAEVERASLAHVRFRIGGGHSRYAFADGSSQSVPALHLVGPTTGATVSLATGPFTVVGFSLTPAGWAALVGTDASTLVNRAVDAGTIVSGSDELAQALRDAPDMPARVTLIADFVARLVAARNAAVPAFVRQVDDWLAASPSPQLETLEATTGLSRRQIERRCNAMYGAPPKVLARKYRALRAAVALVTGGEGMSELLARGFYDQSHLIREIKQFTGCTPRQLRADPPLLARLTIERQRALPKYVTALIRDT